MSPTCVFFRSSVATLFPGDFFWAFFSTSSYTLGPTQDSRGWCSTFMGLSQAGRRGGIFSDISAVVFQ